MVRHGYRYRSNYLFVVVRQSINLVIIYVRHTDDDVRSLGYGKLFTTCFPLLLPPACHRTGLETPITPNM